MSDLAVRELPLFPLPDVVLFPQEVLPLHIFEPRYRMMLRTVLETDRRFGVVRWDPNQQEMAQVGCCAEILQCQTQDDDRSNIVTLGQQRFRVLEVVREAPFRVAMVSWIEDDPSTSHDVLQDLGHQVTQALRDVVDLTGKLIGKPTTLPADLPDLPRELSFWIGSHLGGPVADHQQALLELTDTSERLRQEFALLDYLVRTTGIVLSRQQILDGAWGIDWIGDPRTVDVHIRQLRRKLGDDLPLATVRGIGYRLA